jgi:Ca2+-binding RTX toxin-like protein
MLLGFTFGDGPDTFLGTDADDHIIGGGGDDLLAGGLGNDLVEGTSGADTIRGSVGSDSLNGGEGRDVLDFSQETRGGFRNGDEAGRWWEYITETASGPELENINNEFEVALLTEFADTINGMLGVSTIHGGAGNDSIAGFDYVNNGTPSSLLDGGAGDDTLRSFSRLGDQLLGGEGNDLLDGSHWGGRSDHLEGGTGNDTLIAESADTVLGGEGDDLIRVLGGPVGSYAGGAGNDTYDFQTTPATYTQIIETADGGIDTLRVSEGHTLRENFENLVLTASASGYGNGVANVLTGSGGADQLHGRGGNDTAAGGGGGDTLLGGVGNDSLRGEEGDDLLRGDGGGGDNLVINGSFEGGRTQIGPGRVSAIEGWDLGTPDVAALLSQFPYPIFYSPTDGNWALELRTDAADTVSQAVAGLVTGQLYRLEFDFLVYNPGFWVRVPVSFGGVALAPIPSHQWSRIVLEITGGMGDGSNTLSFGQLAFAGVDNIWLSEYGAGADTLDGGAGNDTLDGGRGNDLLRGGIGDDLYLVGEVTDVASEAGGGGADTVVASVSFAIANGFEVLRLVGAATTGTGNGEANHIIGNALDNTLSGSGGNDTLVADSGHDSLTGGANADSMAGGAGNDTYAVDDAGDVVIETLSGGDDGGQDEVSSFVSFTLGAFLETLLLSGSGVINGTGNTLDNLITGNGANNTLSGLDGADTLNGGLGADTLVGGTGDDVFFVNDAGDVVHERSGGGTDLVIASISYALAPTLEHLTLTGNAPNFGTGNGAANILIGNTGGNRLNGGTDDDLIFGGGGADTLIGGGGGDTTHGGTGNDRYTVDSVLDVVVELSNEGKDTVQSAADLTLGDNLEVLQFSGTGDRAGTGNALANEITGTIGANLLLGLQGDDILTGLDGADTLIGGLGTDLLNGGAGSDRFVFGGLGEGIDRVLGFQTGADVLALSASGFGGVLAPGALAAANFVSHASSLATSAAGTPQFIYDSGGGALYFDIDGAGGTASQRFATLAGAPTLAVTDFVVIA